MTNERGIVFVGAVRTAIGNFGGGLKDKPPTELAAAVLRESVKRAGIKPEEVGQVVFGNVIHTDTHDMYLARVAALQGGLPVETPAFTVNRLCGSGMQAIVSAAQAIKLGETDCAIGGGAESMSRSQYWLPAARWGQRMMDGKIIDAMVGALTDPFDDCHMAFTAEALAKKYNISREEQDRLAVESNRRAIDAIKQCVFKEQILPIELKTRSGATYFDTDEKPRADATFESLAKLKPAFDKNGTVTAGNASGINDGAAALVLMEEQAARERGLAPLGRLIGWSYAGVDPKYMGIGPVPAIRKLLDHTGLTLDDMDVIELNEAFAAQALAVIKELELPEDRTNPHGSGIALGHPIGATGAILAVKALYELKRIGGKYALVSMCIGGGQGIAAVIEGLHD